MPSITHIDYNTRMIKPNADPALNRYPVFWYDMRADNPQWSFSPTPEIELVNQLGYFSVELVPQPPGDVVVEGMPEFRDGDWYQVWDVRSFTPEEVAARLTTAKNVMFEDIKTKVAAALNAGLLVEFPDGEVGYIPMNSKNLADYSFMLHYVEPMVSSGSQETIPVPIQDGIARHYAPRDFQVLCIELQKAYLTFMNTVTAVRDDVFTAATEAELPVVPASFSL